MESIGVYEWISTQISRLIRNSNKLFQALLYNNQFQGSPWRSSGPFVSILHFPLFSTSQFSDSCSWLYLALCCINLIISTVHFFAPDRSDFPDYLEYIAHLTALIILTILIILILISTTSSYVPSAVKDFPANLRNLRSPPTHILLFPRRSEEETLPWWSHHHHLDCCVGCHHHHHHHPHLDLLNLGHLVGEQLHVMNHLTCQMILRKVKVL